MKHGETQPNSNQDLQGIESILLSLTRAYPGSVLVIDAAGVVLYANEALAAKFGRTVRSLIGSCIYDHMQPEAAAQRKSCIDNVLVSGTGARFEDIPSDPLYRNDIRPIPDSTGGVTRVAVLGTDLTDRKQAEERFQASEERFKELVENAIIGFYRTTPEGMILVANPALYRMLGFSSAEELQMRNLEKNGFESHLSRAQFKAELESRDVIAGYESTWIRKDGTKIFVRENAKTVRDPSGKVLYYEGTVEDITHRRSAEEALQASEERFRLISENVADLIAVLDLEGRRVYSSPSYKSIVGEPAVLSGTDSFLQIHPDDRDRVKAVVMEIVRTGVSQRVDHRFVSHDGGIRHVESHGSVIRDQRGAITNVVIVSRDVTEKKGLEQQFLRAQRLESLATLAGGVAHDLNNVLSPLLLAVAALKERAADERDRKMLDTLESNVFRGSAIVKQILAFSRAAEGERIPVQVKHIVKDVISIMRETFPKAIAVRSELPTDTWTVVGDATQIHQVLMNLCVNARDAMPNGGTLTLSVENKTIDQQYAHMHIEAKVGRYVVLGVKDTGIGMPPEILDRVFDPFFTTKEAGKGTGLGLSTVHSIVKSHGGFINVYSEVGKGSVFKVHLPAAESVEPQAAAPQREALVAGNNELVLVVDDEASICEITKKTLEAFGYRAITASDGPEAVAIYASRGKEIAVVITDMVMPLMDGPRTIRALRKLNPQVKIIASSGHLTDGQKTTSKDLGVESVITKPYTAERLLQVIHQVLSGQQLDEK